MVAGQVFSAREGKHFGPYKTYINSLYEAESTSLYCYVCQLQRCSFASMVDVDKTTTVGSCECICKLHGNEYFK